MGYHNWQLYRNQGTRWIAHLLRNSEHLKLLLFHTVDKSFWKITILQIGTISTYSLFSNVVYFIQRNLLSCHPTIKEVSAFVWQAWMVIHHCEFLLPSMLEINSWTRISSPKIGKFIIETCRGLGWRDYCLLILARK